MLSESPDDQATPMRIIRGRAPVLTGKGGILAPYVVTFDCGCIWFEDRLVSERDASNLAPARLPGLLAAIRARSQCSRHV